MNVSFIPLFLLITRCPKRKLPFFSNEFKSSLVKYPFSHNIE